MLWTAQICVAAPVMDLTAAYVAAQVKVDATMALRLFVEEYEEEDIGALKPLIPQLLNEIFKLMSEVCSLLNTLQCSCLAPRGSIQYVPAECAQAVLVSKSL